MKWSHSQSPFSNRSSMIFLEMKAGIGLGLASSTSSHMSMNRLELAMTLHEHGMGLSCTRRVEVAGGGRGILMAMLDMVMGWWNGL
jgi:hypothetical protein